MPLLSLLQEEFLDPVRSWLIPVHDLGDAIAIGISAFLESISNREEDSRYTLGYKRFSF